MELILEPIVTFSQALKVTSDRSIIEPMVTSNEALEQKRAFSRRLNALLDAAGVPPKHKGRQDAVAKAIGVTQKGARKWLEGESIPRREKIIKITETYGGNPVELEYGEKALASTPPPNQGDVAQLQDSQRRSELDKLTSPNRLELVEQARRREDELSKQRSNSEPGRILDKKPNVGLGPEVDGLVPLIGWVIAGKGKEVVDLLEPGDAEEWKPCPVNHSRYTFILRVEGDSMISYNPLGKNYLPGHLIYVDPEQVPENGDPAVVKLLDDSLSIERRVLFKKIIMDGPTVCLRSLNDNYSDIHDEFEVIGKVIGSWDPT